MIQIYYIRNYFQFVFFLVNSMFCTFYRTPLLNRIPPSCHSYRTYSPSYFSGLRQSDNRADRLQLHHTTHGINRGRPETEETRYQSCSKGDWVDASGEKGIILMFIDKIFQADLLILNLPISPYLSLILYSLRFQSFPAFYSPFLL